MSDGWKRLYLSAGILVCYSLLGIAQEKITKASYGDEKVFLKVEKRVIAELLDCLKILKNFKLLKKRALIRFFKEGQFNSIHVHTGFPVSLPTRVGLCHVPVEFDFCLWNWRGTGQQ